VYKWAIILIYKRDNNRKFGVGERENGDFVVLLDMNKKAQLII